MFGVMQARTRTHSCMYIYMYIYTYISTSHDLQMHSQHQLVLKVQQNVQYGLLKNICPKYPQGVPARDSNELRRSEVCKDQHIARCHFGHTLLHGASRSREPRLVISRNAGRCNPACARRNIMRPFRYTFVPCMRRRRPVFERSCEKQSNLMMQALVSDACAGDNK